MNTPASIAHYQLLELIGQDGPIETWRARDARLQRTVAIQLLRPGPETTPEAVDRFRRQAHVASLVTHPHICAVHNWGEEDGQPFVVRELLSGQRLDEVLADGAQPVDRILEVGIQLTGALCAVHRRGLVHGQLRPSNVRVTSDGHVKLLGLGTAVADPTSTAPDLGAFATTAVDIETSATSSPSDADPYHSPEQVAGHPPTAASDVFSIGVLLYEMATGTRPFTGATSAGTLDGDSLRGAGTGAARQPPHSLPGAPPRSSARSRRIRTSATHRRSICSTRCAMRGGTRVPAGVLARGGGHDGVRCPRLRWCSCRVAWSPGGSARGPAWPTRRAHATPSC